MLVLSNDLHDRCVAMARAALPNEACGLLAGDVQRRSTDHLRVAAVHPVPNALASSQAFALDGAGMITAEEAIDASGHVVIGVIHSHPTSEAVPSKRDLADAAQYDPHHTFVHLIVSMQGFAPTIRAFHFDDGGAHEFDLVRGDRP